MAFLFVILMWILYNKQAALHSSDQENTNQSHSDGLVVLRELRAQYGPDFEISCDHSG